MHIFIPYITAYDFFIYMVKVILSVALPVSLGIFWTLFDKDEPKKLSHNLLH